jgi:hypothetical protein
LKRFDQFQLAGSRQTELNPPEPVGALISTVMETSSEKVDEWQRGADAVYGDRDVVETFDNIPEICER